MFWLAEVFNGSFSAEELKRHEQWARRERAEMLRRGFSGIARGIAAGARGLGRLAKLGGKRRRGGLRYLDDRLLGDIGLTRADAALLDKGRLPVRYPDYAGAPTLRDRRRALAQPVIEDGERNRIDSEELTRPRAA